MTQLQRMMGLLISEINNHILCFFVVQVQSIVTVPYSPVYTDLYGWCYLQTCEA